MGDGATRTRDTRLRTVVRSLIVSDPGEVERSSGPLEAARQMVVVPRPKGSASAAGDDD
jgi:hypothetical protein